MQRRSVARLVLPDKRAAYATQPSSWYALSWGGLAIVTDALQRAGIEVGYTTAEDADDKIVLASVTGVVDWFDLLGAWVRARPRNATLVIGGAAVVHVRPFLPLSGAIFVLGRGEDIIAPLVQAEQAGERYEHESVIYPDAFSMERTYRLAQGQIYPHRVRLENGPTWQEETFGCPYRCLFCSYTWARRKPNSGLFSDMINYGNSLVVSSKSNAKMYNLREIVGAWRRGDLLSDKGYNRSAIDGQSERLRRAVQKPVSSDEIIDAARLAPHSSRLSLYTLIGLPTETREDRAEALENLKLGMLARSDRDWGIVLAPNPFRPMPCTPAALWPADAREWGDVLADEWGHDVNGHRFAFYSSHDGRHGLRLVGGVAGSARLLLELLCLRGIEADYDLLERIVLTPRFWNGPSRERRKLLERHIDADRLIREYTPDDYPARNIHSYVSNSKLWSAGAKALTTLRKGGTYNANHSSAEPCTAETATAIVVSSAAADY